MTVTTHPTNELGQLHKADGSFIEISNEALKAIMNNFPAWKPTGKDHHLETVLNHASREAQRLASL